MVLVMALNIHRDNAVFWCHGVVTMLWFLRRDDCYGSCHGLKRRDNAMLFCVVRIAMDHVTALNVVTVLCFLCRDDGYGS